MKIMTILLLESVFILMSASLSAGNINPIQPSDIPDTLITKTDTYNLESVWNYNSSRMDVLTEFGFNSLLVQELSIGHEKIKAEIYQLDSPESAFGIYSLSVINCDKRDTLFPFDCVSGFSYQFAYSNLYVIVTSESGSLNARNLFFTVAKVFRNNNPQPVLILPEIFNLPQLLKSRCNLVYVKGPVGMQNCQIPLQEYFLGMRFSMYAIYLPTLENNVYFARIIFPSSRDQSRFMYAAGLMSGSVPIPNCTTSDYQYHEYKQIDTKTIYFLQSQEPYTIDAILNAPR